MEEITESINKKNSILLSRNAPVALVVGAAGFLGSHLCDKLLEKGIQVVGVDDLQDGRKDNLRKATEDRKFHLVIESPDRVELDLPRLDYLFLLPAGWRNLEKILELFKKTGGRCLLVSSIELYEGGVHGEDLKWLKNAEVRIANFSEINKLNARILRLGSVFGPRMDFKANDPLTELIQQSLNDELQKDYHLEFSSRAIYIADAVDLMVRTMFAGNTAQKIFDGVATTPVKVSEIKQILLDPVWYETKDFSPSALPPWATPNLEKTIKSLNWHPHANVVSALRKTLSYFKDNEIEVPKLNYQENSPAKHQKEVLQPGAEGIKAKGWDKDKKAALAAFKGEGIEESKKSKRQGIGKFKFPLFLSRIYLILVILLISYALIWPSISLGWGILTFRSKLNEGIDNLGKGEFEKSLENIHQANMGLERAEEVFNSLGPVRKMGIFTKQFEEGDNFIRLSDLSVESAQSTVLGVAALLQGLKAVTGESDEPPTEYFKSAQLELSSANQGLSKANALLVSEGFRDNFPEFLGQQSADFSKKVSLYSNLVKKAWAMSVLLPKLVAINGNKSYLVLLQNNMELRPGGGFIGSFAKVSFEGGKLKKLDVNDVYAIDGQLGIHVEPPKEIKEDLNQKDWFLRDSNWEPDFPTSARQAEWFYTKETGERVGGTFVLDVSAMEELLSAIGPLDLPDYKEKITAENLFERAITHAEIGFFPGSQAKKSFLTALTNEAFNKMFFSSQNNWPGIISALGRALDGKHAGIYLDDPELFSYVDAQNWVQTMPRASDQNKNQDFLSVVEANLGANKVNYYLDRSYNLETVVGKEGEIKHRMRISYVNRSPSDAFPGGTYKNRMRVYLPFGTKLTRALWGEADITKDVTSFVDYGRSGYSLLLQLSPKEQKNLVLDYSVPIKIDFKDNTASYRLDIIKQPGTLKDPLQWTITYPISFKAASSQTKTTGPQEQTISTDLSFDRSFEVQFKK